jgi:hypothetical protein
MRKKLEWRYLSLEKNRWDAQGGKRYLLLLET